MDPATLVVAGAVARLLDRSAEDGDRLAIVPLAYAMAPEAVPGTAAWRDSSPQDQVTSRAAMALLANEIGEQRHVWLPRTGRRVWDVYAEVLEHAVIEDARPADPAAVEEAEALLFTEESRQPTDVYKAFRKHQAEVLRLRRALADVGADDSAGKLLEAELEAAEQAWLIEGERGRVEDALAAIGRADVQGDASRWQQAKSELEAAAERALSDIDQFWPTALRPDRLDQVAWERIVVERDDVVDLLESAARRFPDLVGDQPAVAGDVDLISLRCEAAVVRFHRHWLDLSLVESGRWWWPDDRAPVADAQGGGTMPALADGAVLIRNVELRRSGGVSGDAVDRVGPVLVEAGGEGTTSSTGPRLSSEALHELVHARVREVPAGVPSSPPRARADEMLQQYRSTLNDRRARTARSSSARGQRSAPGPSKVSDRVATQRERIADRIAEGKSRITNRLGQRPKVIDTHRSKSTRDEDARPRPIERSRDEQRPRDGERPKERVRARRGRMAELRLSGHVTDAESGAPVRGATVRLESERGQVETAVTGRTGRYTTKVPNVGYAVTVSAEGYLLAERHLPPGSGELPTAPDRGDPVKVRDHRPPSEELDIALEPAEELREAWQMVGILRYDIAPSPDPKGKPVGVPSEPAGQHHDG